MTYPNQYAILLKSFLLALSLSPVALPAQVPVDYYGPVDTSNAATLRATLHELIDNHTFISFDDSGPTFAILEDADADPSDPSRILDIYSNSSFLEVDGGSGDYNREHIWPRSYGFPDESDSGEYPISDLHNLFLSINGYNFARGNEYFDNCNISCAEFTTEFNNGTGGGMGVFPGFSNFSDSDSWQVWVGRQGDAARALFYMDVRYEPLTVDEINMGIEEPDLILVDDPAQILTTGTNAPIGRMGRLSVVVGWHGNDAVDDLERNHNNVVAQAQDNRNPFVDFPEFADCIFGGDCSGVAPIPPQNISTSLMMNSVTLSWDARPETDLAGYSIYRSTTPGGPYTLLNPTLQTDILYTDATISTGDVYYYVVTATDTDANESLNSVETIVNSGPSGSLIAIESFEDEMGFAISGTRDTLNSGSDYIDIYTNATAPAGLSTQTTGIDGSRFLAAEDTNAPGLDNIYSITLDPISITNYSGLEVTIGLNAVDSGNYDAIGQGNQDYVSVFATVDSGAETLIGQFTRVGAGNNGAFGEDTDLDGIGDVEISDYTRLEDYTFAGLTEGDSLDLRIELRFDAGNEEVVLDNIRVTGINMSGVDSDFWQLY